MRSEMNFSLFGFLLFYWVFIHDSMKNVTEAVVDSRFEKYNNDPPHSASSSHSEFFSLVGSEGSRLHKKIRGPGEYVAMCTSDSMKYSTYYFTAPQHVSLFSEVDIMSYKMGIFKSMGLHHVNRMYEIRTIVSNSARQPIDSLIWNLSYSSVSDGSALKEYFHQLNLLSSSKKHSLSSSVHYALPILPQMNDDSFSQSDDLSSQFTNSNMEFYFHLFENNSQILLSNSYENVSISSIIDNLPFSYSLKATVDTSMGTHSDSLDPRITSSYLYTYTIPSSLYYHFEYSPAAGSVFHSLLQSKVSKLHPPPTVPPLLPVILGKIQPLEPTYHP
eukprot:Sdes_comp10917_c0_seq1m2568